MISIIICSRTQTKNKGLSENIKNTIGCDYELVVIDNSENAYSIFEAYNIGIKRSSGDCLCFIHDDILFHTNDWGRMVERILTENKNIGLLGVAGSKYKTKMPSGYWNCPDNCKEINILQHSNGTVEKWYYGFENANLTPVMVIDGVFMVLRKEIEINFNENIRGFHNYDLNISLENYIKGYQTYVTNEILLEHSSNGNVNKSWYESTYKIHELYREILPLATNEDLLTKELELKNGFHFLKYLLRFNFYRFFFKLWFSLLMIRTFDNRHLYVLKLFIKRTVKLIFSNNKLEDE